MSHLELSTLEWTVVEQLKDTLKPFKIATQALSTDAYPTVSAVLPLQHVKLSQLNTPDATQRAAIKEVKAKMIDNFKARYSQNNPEWMLLNKAALLDPRFSRLVHLSSGQKHLVIESLSQELREAEIDGDCAQEMEDVAPPALCAMGSLFGDIYNSINSGSRTNNGIQELKNYMTEPSLPADSNTLHWWRDTGCKTIPASVNIDAQIPVCASHVCALRTCVLHRR
ncbi:hypothetical protein AALO_G00222820 [Alosa alosa]|uniref:HAT C-terminal dimerisation domain-containing protein n=1 Tax=Alosa alosa TaxID=278164 RepID=A0AAV6FYL5_9TELE|nr:hypothetical protein AALO_G00222820 [Alosa alosa]